MTATLSGLGEAKRIEKDRSVRLRWKVADKDNGDTLWAELTVAHRKAGINYFTYERTTEDFFNVSLHNIATEEREGAFSVEKFQIGKGIGLFRYEAGKRFSQKRLKEATERAIAEFTALYEAGDERVLRYFDKDAEE